MTHARLIFTQTPPKPALTPVPSPMGRGEHASQKQKKHQTHKKASPLQRPKPHHLMNCERAVRQRRAALSQFGGRGGTLSPPTHKKTIRNMRCSVRLYPRHTYRFARICTVNLTFCLCRYMSRRYNFRRLRRNNFWRYNSVQRQNRVCRSFPHNDRYRW